jgi:hypothetical protein
MAICEICEARHYVHAGSRQKVTAESSVVRHIVRDTQPVRSPGGSIEHQIDRRNRYADHQQQAGDNAQRMSEVHLNPPIAIRKGYVGRFCLFGSMRLHTVIVYARKLILSLLRKKEAHFSSRNHWLGESDTRMTYMTSVIVANGRNDATLPNHIRRI